MLGGVLVRVFGSEMLGCWLEYLAHGQTCPFEYTRVHDYWCTPMLDLQRVPERRCDDGPGPRSKAYPYLEPAESVPQTPQRPQRRVRIRIRGWGEG